MDSKVQRPGIDGRFGPQTHLHLARFTTGEWKKTMTHPMRLDNQGMRKWHGLAIVSLMLSFMCIAAPYYGPQQAWAQDEEDDGAPAAEEEEAPAAGAGAAKGAGAAPAGEEV